MNVKLKTKLIGNTYKIYILSFPDKSIYLINVSKSKINIDEYKKK